MSKSTTKTQNFMNLPCLLRDSPTDFWTIIKEEYQLKNKEHEILQEYFHSFNLVIGRTYNNAFLNQILKSFFNDIGDKFAFVTDPKETARAFTSVVFDTGVSGMEEISALPFKLLAGIKSFFTGRAQFIENQQISNYADNMSQFQLLVNALFIEIISNDDKRDLIIESGSIAIESKLKHKIFGQQKISLSSVNGILAAQKILEILEKSEISEIYKLLNNSKYFPYFVSALTSYIQVPKTDNATKHDTNIIELPKVRIDYTKFQCEPYQVKTNGNDCYYQELSY